MISDTCAAIASGFDKEAGRKVSRQIEKLQGPMVEPESEVPEGYVPDIEWR